MALVCVQITRRVSEIADQTVCTHNIHSVHAYKFYCCLYLTQKEKARFYLVMHVGNVVPSAICVCTCCVWTFLFDPCRQARVMLQIEQNGVLLLSNQSKIAAHLLIQILHKICFPETSQATSSGVCTPCLGKKSKRKQNRKPTKKKQVRVRKDMRTRSKHMVLRATYLFALFRVYEVLT